MGGILPKIMEVSLAVLTARCRLQCIAALSASLMAQLKNLPADAEDGGVIPGSGRSSWKRKWQPTPVFLPGKSREQRSLVGLQKSQT